MLIIDFKNKFTVDIERTSEMMDRDEFLSIIEYFKKIYLFFDPSTKQWAIDEKRIDEVCMWFDRVNYEYRLTDGAAQRVNELGKQYKCERKVFRNKVFNSEVLSSETKLFEFQKDTINWLLKKNVSLNATDTGGGKTIETVAVISQLFFDGDIDAVFLLVPDGTQYNWKRSFLKFSSVFKETDFHIITNENKIRPFESLCDKSIIIIAAHLLKDVLLSYKKGYKMGSSAKLIRWKSGGFADIKKLWNKNSIACILDESHLIKHSDSIKTKALLSQKKYFDYRFLLSATPNISKIEDIYTQFKFLDSSILRFSEKAFKLFLAKDIDNYFDFNIKEYNQKSVEFLRSQYPLVMIQVLKEDLPEMRVKKEINPVYLDMHPIQKKLYYLISEEEIETLYEDYDEIKWKLLEQKLHQLTTIIDCPELLKRNVYRNPEIMSLLKKWDMKYDPKFILLKSKLEDYVENRNEKVIVFDSSPHILDLLYNQFKKYNPLIIHGSLKGVKDLTKDRDEKEYLFNNDPKHKVIFLSSHTSSRSINLQKMCHRAIYYSIPWDAEEYRQGQDRVYRIVSEHDVYIEPFLIDNSLDIVRYTRATAKVQMNDRSMQNVSQRELANLLTGIV